MESVLQRVFSGAKKFLDILVPSIFFVLLLVITWRVISRYILNSPSTVTEELGRLLLMWLGVLGSALTWAEKKHIAIDIVHQQLSDTMRARLEKLIYLCTTFFGVLLTFGGLHLVQNAFRLSQKTPALGISMGIVYLVVPVGGVCFSLFSLQFFLTPQEG